MSHIINMTKREEYKKDSAARRENGDHCTDNE